MNNEMNAKAPTSIQVDSVLNSIINRVLPTLIVNDIIGVSPMSGPKPITKTTKRFVWYPVRRSVTQQFLWLTKGTKVSKINREIGKLESEWHSLAGHTVWILRNINE